MCFVKKTQGVEFLLKLFVCEIKRTYAVGLYLFGVYLINAVPRKNRNASAHNDLHAVFGFKLQGLGEGSEHNCLYDRFGIFDGKVKMTRFVMIGEIGDLTLDIYITQKLLRVKQGFYVFIQL